MNRQEFYSFYRKEILPLLSKYEDERKKLVNEYRRSFFYLSIPLLMILIVLFIDPSKTIYMKVIISIVLIIGFCFAFKDVRKSFERKRCADFLIKIKKESLNSILSKFGDLKWKVIDEKTYKESISGIHNGVEFEIVEDAEMLSFEFVTKKIFKAETFVHSKFDTKIIGEWFLLAFVIIMPACFLYLHFIGRSLLDRDDFFEAVIMLISGIIFAIICLIYCFKYKKTKLEDVSFNKNYVVRTEDEVEARYFLTTGFMERFKNLQTVFGRKNISCKCENNKITFTIDKKGNPFEVISVFKSFNNPEVMIKLYHEINAIFKIIDYFKLAEDTKI